jgi:GT2 family glycosyltransferase
VTTLSIVIPTRNRGPLLRAAVTSIAPRALAAGAEVLIVDSASTDDTPDVIAALVRKYPGTRSVRSPRAGLLAARHLGADETGGDVLVFVDDDVVVRDGWVEAWLEGFADGGVMIAGGPSLPRWEKEPPWWMELFRQPAADGWTIWPLSLIDCGGERDVPPGCVYGCNFAVRRSAFLRHGGFHPDSVPRELTAWRGDGESALAGAVARGGGRVRHLPKAAVDHAVPASRTTKEYFLWRSFCQGVSASYTDLRQSHGLEPPSPSRAGGAPPAAASRAGRTLGAVLRQGPFRWIEGRRLLRAFERARLAGRDFHRSAARDPAVLSWILRRDYLDGSAMPPVPVPAPPEGM